MFQTVVKVEKPDLEDETNMKKEEETKPDDLDNRIDGIGDRLEGIDKKLEVKKENNMNSQTTLITTSSQTSCQVFSFYINSGFFKVYIAGNHYFNFLLYPKTSYHASF